MMDYLLSGCRLYVLFEKKTVSSKITEKYFFKMIVKKKDLLVIKCSIYLFEFFII